MPNLTFWRYRARNRNATARTAKLENTIDIMTIFVLKGSAMVDNYWYSSRSIDGQKVKLASLTQDQNGNPIDRRRKRAEAARQGDEIGIKV